MANVVKVVNNLIQTCKDGENGFKDAAVGTKNQNNQILFNQYAHQRSQFVHELQQIVEGKLEGNAAEHGHISAALHRAWLNIKQLVAKNDEAGILQECERGEDMAVKTYEDALKEESLPPDVRDVIERQLEIIKRTHDNVKHLRDTFEMVSK